MSNPISDLNGGLLLRPFEVRPAGHQLDENLVQAPATLVGEAGDMGVQLGRHSQDHLAAIGLFGHSPDSSACGTMTEQANRARGATNTQPSTPGSVVPLSSTQQVTHSGTRLRSYEEIVAAESDVALQSVQFSSTPDLIAMVEEYEEKAPVIDVDAETRGQLEHLARLGRDELAKRGES